MTTRTFALEIGTEEIPAFDLKDATTQLETLVPTLLDNAGIVHGEVAIYTTPRRQDFVVKDVAEQTEEKVEKFRGPNKKIAFDENGNPTKALEGFARGKGVSIDDLTWEGEGEKAQCVATVTTPAVNVIDLLPEICLNTINGIKWSKSCNWGSTREVYSRPVRWLCALFGDEVVKFHYANLESGNQIVGHRFMNPGPHTVPSADSLIDTVRAANVIPTQEQREQIIRDGIAKIEKETGLKADIPHYTLVEVINLGEFPTPMVGTFDEEFLQVPEEIIVDSMLVNQRYFPLYKEDGKLSNKYIIVANNDPANEETIVQGNNRVVRARLYDAKFFYEEDLKVPLENNIEKLSKVVYHEKLGTIKDKNDRNIELAKYIAEQAGLSADEQKDVARAAQLAKADLPSQAVIEFTSVQGIMGAYYAAAQGENEHVALAIKEHYCPKFTGDAVPAENVGKAVAVADKLDTVCGLIAVGERPTGSKDPFAIRRAALGVVAILQSGFKLNLTEAVQKSLEILKSQIDSIDVESAKAEVLDFFKNRATKLSSQAGCAADTIDAVVATGVTEPITIIERCQALENARKNDADTFNDLSAAYVRAVNLSDPKLGVDTNESLFSEQEKAMSEAITAAKNKVSELVDTDFDGALSELAKMRKPVDVFFENTFIMDKDDALRENRIKILNRFIDTFAEIADFSKFAK